MKDRKGFENEVANHLSHLESNIVDERGIEINDSFSYQTLMVISKSQVPWYANYANYLCVEYCWIG